ncbi:hypothetical protein [Solibacillus ferritrahens]|uniref:hypothetical protein n=1 Tax=Solibacillus ferritrahens TaxID=3098620 RepID=UPI00300A7AC5
MENLVTQKLKKNIVTELEFTFDEDLNQIFDKCLLIKGVVVFQLVEASDFLKRESITF